MAAGYVVNAVLPLRYFSFLPELERCQLPGEPGEEDFVEITCIWIDKHLTRYCDRGVVSSELFFIRRWAVTDCLQDHEPQVALKRSLK